MRTKRALVTHRLRDASDLQGLRALLREALGCAGESRSPSGWTATSSGSTHGRGLYLMRTLMDVVQVSSRRAGSRVRMGKRLRPEERRQVDLAHVTQHRGR